MSFPINPPAELFPSPPPSSPEPPQVAPVAAASESGSAGDAGQAGVGSQGGNARREGGERPGKSLSDAREQVAGEAREVQPTLTEAEQREVRELRARDREVRAHEAAHAAAAGSLARGAPTYTYVRGPDGRQYAVGGQVLIDTSPVAGDPRATLEKAQRIRRAALAPAEPSAQDRAVAAAATQMAAQARAELNQSSASNGAEQDGATRRGLSIYAEVAGIEPPKATPASPAARGLV
ncbi:MAG: putative metalloprotease CJM1_0395 family protein [Pseudomonadota bacterium]